MANKNDIFTKHGHCHPHCGHSDFLVTNNLLGEFQFMSETERAIARANLGIDNTDIKSLVIKAYDSEDKEHSVVFNGKDVKTVSFYSDDDSIIISYAEEDGEYRINLTADTVDFDTIKKLVEDAGYVLVGSDEWETLKESVAENTGDIKDLQDEQETIKDNITDLDNRLNTVKEIAEEAKKEALSVKDKAYKIEDEVTKPVRPSEPTDVYYSISRCKIQLIPTKDVNNSTVEITYQKVEDGKQGEKITKSITQPLKLGDDNVYNIQHDGTTFAKLHLKDPEVSEGKDKVKLESVMIVPEGDNSVLVETIIFDSPSLTVNVIGVQNTSKKDNIELEITNKNADNLVLNKVGRAYSFLYKTTIPKDGTAHLELTGDANLWYCTNESLVSRVATNSDKIEAIEDALKNDLKATDIRIRSIRVELKKPEGSTPDPKTKGYEYIKLHVVYSIGDSKPIDKDYTLEKVREYIDGSYCYYSIIDGRFAIAFADFKPEGSTMGKIAVYGKDNQFFKDKCNYNFEEIAVSILEIRKSKLYDGDDGWFKIGLLQFQAYTGRMAIHYDTTESVDAKLDFGSSGAEWGFSSDCSIKHGETHLILPVSLDVTGSTYKNKWLCVNDQHDGEGELQYDEQVINNIIQSIYNN